MCFRFAVFFATIFYCLSAQAAVYKYICDDGVAIYSNVSYDTDTDEFRNLTEDKAYEFYVDYGYSPVGWKLEGGKIVKKCNIMKKEDLSKAIQKADNEAKVKRESDFKKLKEQSDAIKNKVETFRKNLKIGDRSSYGLVVEVKPPIALIQREQAVQWIRIDELYPQ